MKYLLTVQVNALYPSVIGLSGGKDKTKALIWTSAVLKRGQSPETKGSLICTNRRKNMVVECTPNIKLRLDSILLLLHFNLVAAATIHYFTWINNHKLGQNQNL